MKVPSAEALCNVLRPRGVELPVAVVRRNLQQLSSSEEALLLAHYQKAITGVDDTQSIGWLRERLSAEPATGPAQNVEKRTEGKVKLYGKQGAFTIEASAPSGAPLTLWVEGTGATGKGAFDWDRKIVFSASLAEVVLLLAGFMKWMDCHLDFHGEQNAKCLSLHAMQPGPTRMMLREGNRRVTVTVEPAKAFALAALLIKVIISHEPHLSSDTVLTLCRQAARATEGQNDQVR